jgi:hypothetical protein
MYFAHRKGWIGSNEVIAEPEYRADLKSRGLDFIVILKQTFGAGTNLPLTIVFENEDYRIYKLEQ